MAACAETGCAFVAAPVRVIRPARPRRARRVRVRCSMEPHHHHHHRARPQRVRTPDRARRALKLQLALVASEARVAGLRSLRREVDARRRLRVAARPPFWTYVLLFGNGFLFLLGRLYPSLGARMLSTFSLGSLPTLLSHPWRMLTAPMLHLSLGHLALNGGALLALGGAVEMLFGRAGFLAVYLAGAAGANGLSAIASPAVSSAGASGPVHALAAALLVHLRANGDALGRRADPTARAFGLAILLAFVGAVAAPGVDAAAHAGGLVAGAVAGALVAPAVIRSGRVARVRRVRWQRAVFVAGAAVAFAIGALRLAARFAGIG